MKVSDESTIIQNDVTPVDNEAKSADINSRFWRDVLIGGVPGILLGSAGTIFAANHMPMNGSETTPEEDVAALKEEVAALREEVAELKEDLTASSHRPNIPAIGDTVEVAHSVNDNMSFSEAFAAARAEVGAGGVFTWHGDVYGTYYEDEWNSMTDEQKHDYANAVRHSDYDYQSAQESSNSVAGADTFHDAHDEEGEIRVLGEETVQTEDGQIINVAHVEVDGHYGEMYDFDNDGRADAALIDTNDDGAPDIALVDENGDGVIDENEVYQVDDPGMLAMNSANPEDAIYEGMPDYTNDADTSSFA